MTIDELVKSRVSHIPNDDGDVEVLNVLGVDEGSEK